MFISFSIPKCVLTALLQDISCNSSVLVKNHANGKAKELVRYIDVNYDASSSPNCARMNCCPTSIQTMSYTSLSMVCLISASSTGLVILTLITQTTVQHCSTSSGAQGESIPETWAVRHDMILGYAARGCLAFLF